MTCEFIEGERFHTFQELLDKIQRFQKEKCVKLSINDSTSLKAAQKAQKVSRAKQLNEEIKYYYVNYGCIHYGIHHSRGKGIREAR